MQGKKADQKHHRWTTYFNGLDTRWKEFLNSQKTESDGDNLFMVCPVLGLKTAEGKARQSKVMAI